MRSTFFSHSTRGCRFPVVLCPYCVSQPEARGSCSDTGDNISAETNNHSHYFRSPIKTFLCFFPCMVIQYACVASGTFISTDDARPIIPNAFWRSHLNREFYETLLDMIFDFQTHATDFLIVCHLLYSRYSEEFYVNR